MPPFHSIGLADVLDLTKALKKGDFFAADILRACRTGEVFNVGAQQYRATDLGRKAAQRVEGL